MNNKVHSSYLYRFLAVDRWRALSTAYSSESAITRTPALGYKTLSFVLIITCLPLIFALLPTATYDPSALPIDLSSLTLGIAALLAIIFHRRFHVPAPTIQNLPASLSLTHTAFALGCIPAVIVLFLYPEILSERSDVMTAIVGASDTSPEAKSWFIGIFFIILVAAWAAVTEEYLFRAFFLAALRRSTLPHKQQHKDIIAILLSALLFAAAHASTWGIAAAIALFGIGIGFGIAFVATGERIVPLVLYHFCYDVLSIIASRIV